MVGRIIRARKLSSAGAACLGRLCLDDCFRRDAEGGGPRAGRAFSSLEDLCRNSCFGPRLVLLGDRDTTLVDAPSDCWAGAAAAAATFESDEDVGAVKDDGSLTGFVGNLGLGLMKVLGGDVTVAFFADVPAAVAGVAFFSGALVAVEEEGTGREAALEEVAEARDALLVFFSTAFV